MEKRVAYPTFIKQVGSDYLIYVPDLKIYTEAYSFPEAMESARDAIGLKLLDVSDEHDALPKASTPAEAMVLAKEDADDSFDYSDGIMTYVDVDLETYRNRIRNRAVKKNCTLPFWLSEKAEKEGINFSKVLQEALLQKLNNG